MENKQTVFEILQSKLTIEDSFDLRQKHIPEILDAMEEYANQKLTNYVNRSHELMLELIAKSREDMYELMSQHVNLYKKEYLNSPSSPYYGGHYDIADDALNM